MNGDVSVLVYLSSCVMDVLSFLSVLYSIFFGDYCVQSRGTFEVVECSR